MTNTVAPGARPLIDSLRAGCDDNLLQDDRLHARLGEEAEQTGLLDIAYRTVDSPIGSLLLAATPAGLVRVAFDHEGYDAVLAHLAAAISPRVLRAPRRLDGAASQLEEYFTGLRRVRRLIDLQLVYRVPTLRHGPSPGHPVRCDGKRAGVARASGNPTAVRAAASACSHNPVPVVDFCHRVVRHRRRRRYATAVGLKPSVPCWRWRAHGLPAGRAGCSRLRWRRPDAVSTWSRHRTTPFRGVNTRSQAHFPALVAQRIEHLTTDQKVGGSNPSERARYVQVRALPSVAGRSEHGSGSRPWEPTRGWSPGSEPVAAARKGRRGARRSRRPSRRR